MTIEIRPATPSDAPQILAFITELADYERARHEVIASVADIERSLFSEGATAHGLICLRDGLPIGFAVFFFSYSTWLGSNCLYLEDLYITPEQRGGGAGKTLLRHLAKIACQRLRALRMERSGVEHPSHRFLQIPGRAAAGGVGSLPHGRQSASRVRRR
jgi:GNAT superfamily N-acetyltransferase